MNCHAFINVQDLHAENRLSPSLKKAAQVHLAACPNCRALAKPAPAPAPAPRAPDSLKEKLLAAAKAAAPTPVPAPAQGFDRPSLGEKALLALVFLAPLLAAVRAFAPAAPDAALLEICALALAAAWLLKGLERGRWEAPAAAKAALLPLLALAAWTLARFAAAPSKTALLPDLVPALSAGVVYAAALLEFGGARSAARLSFWTAAAALPAAALIKEPFPSFAAAALPIALAAQLDPEASRASRLLSAAAAAALALLAARSGAGLAAFALSAVLFAAASTAILRGQAARRAALLALASAALAAIAAPQAQDALLQSSTLNPASLVLLAWTALAAAACGFGAAWSLRRRGALAEAGYAAAFAAAFSAWALSRALGLTPPSGAGAWLAWAAAGIAAGMGSLAQPRAAVLALPLPFDEATRCRLRAPALALIALLAAAPGLWLVSDVRYGQALAAARAGDLGSALAQATRVWPGSAAYPAALDLRGQILFDQNKPQEALAAYARLERVSPGFPALHAHRAQAYAALQDWPAAAQERELQNALTPLDLQNLIAWTKAARASGDLLQARRLASRAQALSPHNPSVQLQIAANTALAKRLALQDTARRKFPRKKLAFKRRPK